MASYCKHNRFYPLIFALLCTFLFAAVAQAAVYYVAPSGDDGSDGSEGHPWLTIQKAANMVIAGDTVSVQPGTYQGRVTIKISGTAGNKIIFKSATSRTAIVDGLEVEGDYVRIEGFKVIDSSGTYNVYSIAARGANDEIVGNYVETHWGGIGSFGANGLISQNYLYKPQQGIGVAAPGSITENNEVNGLKQWLPGYDSDYMRFFGPNNIIRGNYFHGMDMREVGDSHSDCMQSFDNNDVNNSVSGTIIENNICKNSMEGIIIEATVYRQSNGVTVRNNVFECPLAYAITLTDVANVYIYNNTIANSGSKGIACLGDSGSCYINNNIIYMSNSAYYAYYGGTLSTRDHNLLYKGTSRLDGIYYDSDFPYDILNQDPMFINANKNLMQTYINTDVYHGDSSHFETRAGYQADFIPGEYMEFCPALLCDGIPRKISSVGTDGMIGFDPAIDNYTAAGDPTGFFIKLWGNNNTNYNLDLHLQSGSPAIGAGTVHNEFNYDIEGNPRTVSAGGGWAIGAYQQSKGSIQPPSQLRVISSAP